MEEKTKAKNFLKLKITEETVFLALSAVPQSVAKIAKKAKLPRMTVFESLRSLKHRGIAKRIQVGKRHFWLKINSTQITNLLQLAFDSILEPNKKQNKKLFVRISENAEDIFESLKKAIIKNSEKRLIGIQSTASARLNIKTLGVKKTAELNNLIKQQGVIVEGILGGDFTELKKEFGKIWSESYAGRSAAITFLPTNLLNLSEDVYIFPESLFVINWGEKRALEIIHPEIVSTFQEIARALSLLGRKVDINELIRK